VSAAYTWSEAGTPASSTSELVGAVAVAPPVGSTHL
jgi:hypothetical protein